MYIMSYIVWYIIIWISRLYRWICCKVKHKIISPNAYNFNTHIFYYKTVTYFNIHDCHLFDRCKFLLYYTVYWDPLWHVYKTHGCFRYSPFAQCKYSILPIPGSVRFRSYIILIEKCITYIILLLNIFN